MPATPGIMRGRNGLSISFKCQIWVSLINFLILDLFYPLIWVISAEDLSSQHHEELYGKGTSGITTSTLEVLILETRTQKLYKMYFLSLR